MAQEKELIETLGVQDLPITAGDLAKQVNASVESVATQLKRLKVKGLVINDKEGWSISDDGRESMNRRGSNRPGVEVEHTGRSMTEEGVLPYDSFSDIGRRIGINDDRVRLAADMVFGGDYEDLKWVWEALSQQGLRNDVKAIWFNNWRALIKKPVPAEIAEEVFLAKTEGDKKTEADGKKGARDYILVDDMPVRVGQGVGDFDLETAKELAALRALRERFSGHGTSTPADTPKSLDERLPELITALSSFREKPDQDGVNTLLKELSDVKFDAFRQDIISKIPLPHEPKSFMEQLIEFSSGLQTIGPVLKTLLGIPEPHPGTENSATPIQLVDANGNPMVMDINSFITFKKLEIDEKRADEEFKNKREMTGTVKDFLGKIAAAAGKVASRE